MDSVQKYFNREQSWLAFNERVLEEAQDETLPLLERLRFLAIVSSNLDEFVMVRLAELHANRHKPSDDPTGLSSMEQLHTARARVRAMTTAQYACWQDEIAPALALEGLRVVAADGWSNTDKESLAAHYYSALEPTLTPLAVDPTRPFPLVANRGLCIAVALEAEEGHVGAPHRALVVVPKADRLIALPGEAGRFALLEAVVEQQLDSLFPGHRIVGRAQFRVTRDASFEVEEEGADGDLLNEMEEELRNRHRGRAVRLEVLHGADADLQQWLQEAMDLDADDVYPVSVPLDPTVFFPLSGQLDRPDLCYKDFKQRPIGVDWEEPFARMREQEFLLHHPYDSFEPVVELVQKAAADPAVLAIKQTLYRVSGDSPIVKALMAAARAGKQVTVLVELKARFDEAANIRWARSLEEAGAHVVYGLVGLKVHAKLLLIIRRDDDGIRRYCHLGTGNYNDKTARIYTDASYLTCNPAVGRDMSALFNLLTGFAQPPEWERLAVAPTTMRSSFVRWIRNEAEAARAEKPARIIAKFNSLVDCGICDELYAASQAGVEIDLIVRGMCILRPGVPGLGDNIRVNSIVGRFLEHSRIFYFLNGGNERMAIASADWMTRNLDRRVEHLVMIETPALKAELQAQLQIFLADNAKTRVLHADGSYSRRRPGANESVVDAQKTFLKLSASEAVEESADEVVQGATRTFVALRAQG